MAFVVFHDLHPYSNVVRTLLLKKQSLVFKLIFLLFQMFLREANARPALKSLALTSDSESPSVVILEPRYVNSVTSFISVHSLISHTFKKHVPVLSNFTLPYDWVVLLVVI